MRNGLCSPPSPGAALIHQFKLFIPQFKRSCLGSKEGSACDGQQRSAHNGGGRLDVWDADTFITSLSRWSQWDDQWAMGILSCGRLLLPRWNRPDGDFMVVNMSPQTSPTDAPVLRPLRRGGGGTLESLEKTVRWRVGHNSCRTKTPREKGQRLWSVHSVLRSFIVLGTNLTSAIFLVTALEKAVSEPHSWLKDRTHSNSINKPEAGMRSGHKFKAGVLGGVHQCLKM